MNSDLSIQQLIGVRHIRRADKVSNPLYVEHLLQWKNPFSAMHWREINGIYRCINVVNGWNGVTIEGKNYLLDVAFGNTTPVTQIDPWYIGMINQTPTPVLDEADTLASHSGWAEFTDYSGNRVEWDDSDAASKVKGSDTTSDFTFTGSGEVHGIMIASASSGSSGTLWATGSFDTSITVVATDILKITYGVRC